MKLARVLLPAIAVMAIVLSAIPAPAAEAKVKIGISLALFDDVFITNVRPAALKRAGLDEATLRKANPRLVYTIVTGYGRTRTSTVGSQCYFCARNNRARLVSDNAA